MKNFYRVMGVLSVYNIVNSIYLGNYGLALSSLVCFMVFAIKILSLVRKEIEEDYITLKELIEREDI